MIVLLPALRYNRIQDIRTNRARDKLAATSVISNYGPSYLSWREMITLSGTTVTLRLKFGRKNPGRAAGHLLGLFTGQSDYNQFHCAFRKP